MSMRSRKAGQRRRGFATMALVFAGTLFAYLFATAIPAMASVSVCTDTPDIDPGAPVVHQVAVSVGTDNTTALRFVAGALQLSDNPPADLTTAVFAACGGAAPINVVRITGQDNGNETVRLVNGGGGADANGWGGVLAASGPETFVNLGNGSDTFEILTLGVASLGVEFGTSVGGTTIADANWNTEVPATDSADIQILNTETVKGSGSNDPLGATDNILAGGDSFAKSIDITPVGAGPEDVTVPGTADTGADTTGSDPRGNLTVPILESGGTGNDNLEPGNGNDTIAGGAGDDTVVYAEAPSAVTVDLTAGTETGGSGNDALSDIQSVAGSVHSDTITGSLIDNRISGCGGNDTLDGGAGNDTIRGDRADPTLPPGLTVCLPADDGSDTIIEGTAPNGSDVIQGDGSEVGGVGDTLDYSGRTAALYVAPGGGAVSGEGGCPLGVACEKDNIAADIENYLLGSGNDTFVGSANDEFVTPGAGDDAVDGGGGFDYLDLSDAAGPAVFDTVAGTATGDGNDTFKHVEGFVGTAAGDTLTGDDTTLQTGGPNCGGPITFDFIGLGGTDTVDGSSGTLPECIDLQTFSGHSVENATGGSGDDILIGNILGNVLMGNSGVDQIDGLGGNDAITGGAGNDLLDTVFGPLANTGADSLWFTSDSHHENVDNQLGFATGGDGQDAIGFFAIIHGTDGKDKIRAGQNAFSLNQRLYGGAGNDKLTGSNSSDVLNAGDGNDTIHGGGGDDTENGGAGNDKLYGSSGDDTLNGAAGNDWGWGGSGNDDCHAVEHRHSC